MKNKKIKEKFASVKKYKLGIRIVAFVIWSILFMITTIAINLEIMNITLDQYFNLKFWEVFEPMISSISWSSLLWLVFFKFLKVAKLFFEKKNKKTIEVNQ